MNLPESISPAWSKPSSLLPGLYRFDPPHTFAEFRVKHLIVGLVDGRFNTIQGEFGVTDDVETLFSQINVRVET